MSISEPAVLVSTPPTASKYATALLSVAVVLVTAVTVLPDFTPVSLLQFAVLALGAVATYIVPIVDVRWRGVWKVGVAILAAVVTAVIAAWGDVWTVQTVAVVVLAAVQILAAHLGVAIRVDAETPPADAPFVGGIPDVASDSDAIEE